ncbi:hypothetical protein C5167_019541 [Papaver somniferum]|uniref:Uncharacterized protein n=1 Tax=Papaver somniferum TaxID=3469 RepID=A0A4Y7ITK4_PAPSO|nr:hypothetical protein C5167_019541 [Papaver somniferum]
MFIDPMKDLEVHLDCDSAIITEFMDDTIPSIKEVTNNVPFEAYAELLQENGTKIQAWFFFSSKDGVNVELTVPLLYLFMD